MKQQVPFQDRLWGFNQLKPSDYEEKQKYIELLKMKKSELVTDRMRKFIDELQL